jgi:hypothetical protein
MSLHVLHIRYAYPQPTLNLKKAIPFTTITHLEASNAQIPWGIMLVLGHVFEKGMTGMKTFTRIVDEPSQSPGTLVGLTKTPIDMCCLEASNLNESIGFSHMIHKPKTNNEHKPNSMYQNHIFGDFRCTILVLKNNS